MRSALRSVGRAWAVVVLGVVGCDSPPTQPEAISADQAAPSVPPGATQGIAESFNATLVQEVRTLGGASVRWPVRLRSGPNWSGSARRSPSTRS
jgi:hypothetical protein